MLSTDTAGLCVVLCSGSDCAKDERKAYRSLARRLNEVDAAVVRSRCLGVCHGPVVVVADQGGQSLVQQRIRSKKRQKRLVAAVATGELANVLTASPQVTKRKRRDRALARAARVLQRDRLAPLDT